MSKRKEMKSYNQGLVDGVKPFDEKLKSIENNIKEHTNKKTRDINQKVSHLIQVVDSVIDDQKESKKLIDAYDEELHHNRKIIDRHGKRIRKIEIKSDSTGTVCIECGSALGKRQVVCSNCGAISVALAGDFFDSEPQLIENDEEIMELSRIIKESNKQDSDWLDSELYEILLKMKRIANISKHAMTVDGMSEASKKRFKKIYFKTQNFFKVYRKKHVEVALIGVVKSGKSSLLNAIIGHQVASVDSTPETSVLAKYRTTEDKNYIKVFFYTKKEWDNLFKSAGENTVFMQQYRTLGAEKEKDTFLGKKELYMECSAELLPSKILEWTESKSRKHFFVKQIEVGYKSDELPHNIFLVDTPGLNDQVKYRSNITRRYVKSADWIVVCVKSEGMSESTSFKLLGQVRSLKNGDLDKVYVVATKKDEVSGFAKVEREFKSNLAQEMGSEVKAISHYYAVAAEMHLFTKMVLSGQELDKEMEKKLKKAFLEYDFIYPDDIISRKGDIFKAAGISTFKDHLFSEVISKHSKHLRDEVIDSYHANMIFINKLAKECIAETEELYDRIMNKHDIKNDEIQQLNEDIAEITLLEQKVDTIMANLEKEIISAEKNLR